MVAVHGETITDLSKRLGAARYVIQYVVRSRGISPTLRVGSTHVFDSASVKRIEKALAENAQRRQLSPSGSK